ncbi:hypothetical protein CPAR01_10941 [Colletotrichum paranaense]|uniref:Uncharacterized protein n=1 Tax=Colletotrichum paranaense TaxID=1914294 RepID=A0ABQ9SA90_9PEZI|nr:uncharacterized protein CPAR01_10941 [Colletotrichum paranaense]KAK1531292.1 hypothetical protein CPAR01_10941 [Colletotrichum paranaense]
MPAAPHTPSWPCLPKVPTWLTSLNLSTFFGVSQTLAAPHVLSCAVRAYAVDRSPGPLSVHTPIQFIGISDARFPSIPKGRRCLTRGPRPCPKPSDIGVRHINIRWTSSTWSGGGRQRQR